MNSPSPTTLKLPPFPASLRGLLARLPQYPPSAIFAAALTFQAGDKLGADANPEFSGKLIRLHVIDAGVTVTLRVTPRGFAPSDAADADITLTATAQDFLEIALGREDPDTLFFNRRLVMEGDTELALLVKNHLDAIAFKPSLPAPRDVLRRIHALIAN